jgi:hypothetical protein
MILIAPDIVASLFRFVCGADFKMQDQRKVKGIQSVVYSTQLNITLNLEPPISFLLKPMGGSILRKGVSFYDAGSRNRLSLNRLGGFPSTETPRMPSICQG